METKNIIFNLRTTKNKSQDELEEKDMPSQIDYWKRYEELGDNGQFDEFKKQLKF